MSSAALAAGERAADVGGRSVSSSGRGPNELPNEILSIWPVVLEKREKVVYDMNHTKRMLFPRRNLFWDFIVFTVKEIREQIAQDILGTADIWMSKGHLKSRKTSKAFLVSAAIARGENEIINRKEKQQYE